MIERVGLRELLGGYYIEGTCLSVILVFFYFSRRRVFCLGVGVIIYLGVETRCSNILIVSV